MSQNLRRLASKLIIGSISKERLIRKIRKLDIATCNSDIKITFQHDRFDLIKNQEILRDLYILNELSDFDKYNETRKYLGLQAIPKYFKIGSILSIIEFMYLQSLHSDIHISMPYAVLTMSGFLMASGFAEDFAQKRFQIYSELQMEYLKSIGLKNKDFAFTKFNLFGGNKNRILDNEKLIADKNNN